MQNGVFKHKNRTLVEYAWNMFKTITFIIIFWAKGLHTSCLFKKNLYINL